MGGGTAKISASGTVTLSEPQERITIQHNLGVVPQIVKIWCDEDNTAVGTYSQTAIYLKEATAISSNYRYAEGRGFSSSCVGPKENNETETVFNNSASSRPWMAGVTYYWEVYAGIQ